MPLSRRARISACVLGGLFFSLTPANYVAYESAHSALHSEQHPYAAVVSRPFYYVKVWPGAHLAYLRHSLE